MFKAADRGMAQKVMIYDSGRHDLQSENVLLLVIFQTYGISSHYNGHSYVCSMCLWFSYIMFVATAARDQLDNILCCAVCVLP